MIVILTKIRGGVPKSEVLLLCTLYSYRIDWTKIKYIFIYNYYELIITTNNNLYVAVIRGRRWYMGLKYKLVHFFKKNGGNQTINHPIIQSINQSINQ